MRLAICKKLFVFQMCFMFAACSGSGSGGGASGTGTNKQDNTLVRATGPEIESLIFNDPVLQECVEDNARRQGAKYASELKRLSCRSNNIVVVGGRNLTLVEDASGIEQLVGLEELDLYQNVVKKIELSENLKLKSINLAANGLTEISVNHLSELEYLNLASNDLVDIDLGGLGRLKYVNLSSNKINSFDATAVPMLESLYLASTGVEQLDLRTNTRLEEFSTPVRLKSFNGDVEHLGLSLYPDLRLLELNTNSFSSIDLTQNMQLEMLTIAGPGYSDINQLDLTNNSQIMELRLRSRQIDLELATNNQLVYLEYTGLGNVDNVSFPELDLTAAPNLQEFYCFVCKIKSLDLSNSPQLKTLDVLEAQLELLSVNNNAELEYIDVTRNNLQIFDVSGLVKLKTLKLADNELVAMDLSNNLDIRTVNLSRNNLNVITFNPDPFLYQKTGALTVDARNNSELSSDKQYYDTLPFVVRVD